MKKTASLAAKIAVAVLCIGMGILTVFMMFAGIFALDDAFFRDRRELRKAYGVFCEKNAAGDYVTYDAHGNAYTLKQFEEDTLDEAADCWVDTFRFYNADGDSYTFCNSNTTRPWFYYRCAATGDCIIADNAFLDVNGNMVSLPSSSVTVHFRNDVDSRDHDYDYDWYYTDSDGNIYLRPEQCTWDSKGTLLLRYQRSLDEIRRDNEKS